MAEQGSSMDFDVSAYRGVKEEAERDEDAELDETLRLDDADRSVWMLKVPDFLYQRWVTASANGEEQLGTLRMHPARRPGESGTFTISLPQELGSALPSASATTNDPMDLPIPTDYEVQINNEHSSNLFVFGEQELHTGPSKKRKREPFMAGTIKHECNVKPTLNAEYKRIMMQRERAAEPKRKLKMIEGDLGTLNRLAAGMGNVESAAGFKGFVKNAKTRGGDKAVRLPRPEIESALFQLYDEKAYWGVQDIVGRLNQPMLYVKEVLNDIGQQINAGPYKGQYGLKAAFKSRTQEAAGPSTQKLDEDDDDLLFDEIA